MGGMPSLVKRRCILRHQSHQASKRLQNLRQWPLGKSGTVFVIASDNRVEMIAFDLVLICSLRILNVLLGTRTLLDFDISFFRV